MEACFLKSIRGFFDPTHSRYTMPVLVGKKGVGKGEFIQALSGKEWCGVIRTVPSHTWKKKDLVAMHHLAFIEMRGMKFTRSRNGWISARRLADTECD